MEYAKTASKRFIYCMSSSIKFIFLSSYEYAVLLKSEMKSHNSNKLPNKSPQSEHETLAATDFDRWASAVKQQMLDCLKKRNERSLGSQRH
jgi:hypothetical protein